MQNSNIFDLDDGNDVPFSTHGTIELSIFLCCRIFFVQKCRRISPLSMKMCKILKFQLLLNIGAVPLSKLVVQISKIRLIFPFCFS